MAKFVGLFLTTALFVTPVITPANGHRQQPAQIKEAGGGSESGLKPARTKPILVAGAKRKCKGGGLAGAMECVAEEIEQAGSEPGKKPASASSTDPKTGVTTKSEQGQGGKRTVTKTDKKGKTLSKETVGKEPASASSTDPETGITTTSVRNPGGTRTVTKTDKHGKVISKKVVGKEPASASSTDPETGITTTSKQNPGGTRTITKTDAQGNILSREKAR